MVTAPPCKFATNLPAKSDVSDTSVAVALVEYRSVPLEKNRSDPEAGLSCPICQGELDWTPLTKVVRPVTRRSIAPTLPPVEECPSLPHARVPAVDPAIYKLPPTPTV